MQVVRRLKETSANATVAQLRRWSRAVDENGNTALILGAKRLMNCGLFKRAYQFAVMMLKFGSDVNWLNNGGRSLITYTVHYMDQAIDITRLLLNCGATVWLEGEMIYNGKVTPKPTHSMPYNRKLGIKIKSMRAQALKFSRNIFPTPLPRTHTTINPEE